MMKKEYKAPALTVVAFRAERGFATSGSPIDNVAEAINGTTEFVLTNGQTQWAEGQDQVVGGYSTDDGIDGGNDGSGGLAAGYFGTGSTSGWF